MDNECEQHDCHHPLPNPFAHIDDIEWDDEKPVPVYHSSSISVVDDQDKESEPDSKSESEPDSKSDSDLKLDSDLKSEVEPDSKSDSKSELEPDSKSESADVDQNNDLDIAVNNSPVSKSYPKYRRTANQGGREAWLHRHFSASGTDHQIDTTINNTCTRMCYSWKDPRNRPCVNPKFKNGMCYYHSKKSNLFHCIRFRRSSSKAA